MGQRRFEGSASFKNIRGTVAVVDVFVPPEIASSVPLARDAVDPLHLDMSDAKCQRGFV